MIANSFDVDTAKEIVGDSRTRKLEDKARKAAVLAQESVVASMLQRLSATTPAKLAIQRWVVPVKGKLKLAGFSFMATKPPFTKPPPKSEIKSTYWGQVQSNMEINIYHKAYQKRVARLERMAKK